MEERRVVTVVVFTVLHLVLLGLPRSEYLSRHLSLPPGLLINDLIDGAVAVAVVHAHLLLALALTSRGASTSILQAHSLLGGLLLLAQGGHMVANPIDFLLKSTATLKPKAQDIVFLHNIIHWQHEYYSHRLFVGATMGLWLSLCTHAPLLPRPAARLRWSVALRLCLIVHVIAFGVFVIGTRSAPIASPLAAMLLLNNRFRVGRGGSELVLEYASAFAAGLLALQLGWAMRHSGLPTFEDLRGGSQMQAEHAALPPLTQLARAWAAPMLTAFIAVGLATCHQCGVWKAEPQIRPGWRVWMD